MDETRWNCSSSLSYTVPTAPPSGPCHQCILQDSHGKASEITNIVSSLIMGCCSCFTELVSGLLVGGTADTRTPVWLVVRGTHVMKWFESINQQSLIMTASFPCVLIKKKKTPNILENLDIKLFWRNRLRFEDIKL